MCILTFLALRKFINLLNSFVVITINFVCRKKVWLVLPTLIMIRCIYKYIFVNVSSDFCCRVIFGMLIALPITLLYYILLGL